MPGERINKKFDMRNTIFLNGQKGEQPMSKIPAGIYLLRKSKTGGQTPVMKEKDFPVRFQFSGKDYIISKTRRGKLIMTTEETA